MKLRLFVIPLFLWFTTTSNAQNKEKDSTSYYFETIQKTLQNKDYATAMQLSEKAIARFKDNDSISGLANLILGKILFTQRQYGASVQHLNTAVAFFTKMAPTNL